MEQTSGQKNGTVVFRLNGQLTKIVRFTKLKSTTEAECGGGKQRRLRITRVRFAVSPATVLPSPTTTPVPVLLVECRPLSVSRSGTKILKSRPLVGRRQEKCVIILLTRVSGSKKKYVLTGEAMSVLKSKRGLSKMEFYHNARKLRRELTEFLRRNFGVHSRKNASKINPTLPDDWYDEDIVDFSKNIRILLRNLVWNITAANTINASSEKLVEEKKKRLSERRGYQNAAIINCQQLIQEFQFCEDSLPINAEKLLPYVESLNLEITLLKGWRKSDNKLWEQIFAFWKKIVK